MEDRITGIDIGEDAVSAVQVRSRLKGMELAACCQFPLGEGGLPSVLEKVQQSMNLAKSLTVVSLPEGHVSFRNIALPFQDPKKIRQTLPFEMEGSLPFSAEDLVVDFVETDASDRGKVLAAACQKAFVAGFLQTLHSCGMDPDILDVRGAALASPLLKNDPEVRDFLVLDVGLKTAVMVLCAQRRVVLIRMLDLSPAKSPSPGALSRAVHNTLHAFEAQWQAPVSLQKIYYTGPGAASPEGAWLLESFPGLPAEALDLSCGSVRMGHGTDETWVPEQMNGALALALRGARGGFGFNFRRDGFQAKGQGPGLRKEMRRVVLLAGGILALLAADALIDRHFLQKQYNDLNRQIAALFQETLPGVSRMVDPVAQLRVEVEQLKRASAGRSGGHAGGDVLDLLREISQAIAPSLQVQFNSMTVDPEWVRLRGKTRGFNDVEQVKMALQKGEGMERVAITSANLDRSGKAVDFEIQLRRTP